MKTNFIYCVPATRIEDNKKYYKIGLCSSKGGWPRKHKRLREYPYPDKMKFNKDTLHRWYVKDEKELREIEELFHSFLSSNMVYNIQPSKEFFEKYKSEQLIELLATFPKKDLTVKLFLANVYSLMARRIIIRY